MSEKEVTTLPQVGHAAEERGLVRAASGAGTQAAPYLPSFACLSAGAQTMPPEALWRAVFEGAWPDAFFESDEGLALLHENLVLRLSGDAVEQARASKGAEFRRFLSALARLSGEVLRYNALARDAGVTAETVKRWVAAAEAAGIVYLLRPWPGETGRQLMRSPKLLMIDTGLIAALLGLRTPDEMASHPAAMRFLETFVATAVMRSWSEAAAPHAFYYMKDSKGFSIDLLIETETALYPINVQKGDTLGKADWRSFEKLARLSGLEKPVGTGAAIGLTPRAFAVSDTAVAHGPEWIWERRLALGRARLTEDANEDASA